MLVGRAWPHHIGFCGIGFGIPRIGRKHALGLCPHDHHMRACLDPIVAGGLFCGVGIGVAGAIVAPDLMNYSPPKENPTARLIKDMAPRPIHVEAMPVLESRLIWRKTTAAVP